MIKWGETGEKGKLLRYILIGEDDYSIHRSLEEIKKGLGDPGLLAANTTTLNGQQATLNQLRAIGGTLPFLAEKRLVIVNGLLESFEPQSKHGRTKISYKPDPKNEYISFAEQINNLPDSTVVVLVNGSVGRLNC